MVLTEGPKVVKVSPTCPGSKVTVSYRTKVSNQPQDAYVNVVGRKGRHRKWFVYMKEITLPKGTSIQTVSFKPLHGYHNYRIRLDITPYTWVGGGTFYSDYFSIEYLSPNIKLISTSFPKIACLNSLLNISSVFEALTCPAVFIFGVLVNGKPFQTSAELKPGERAKFSKKITLSDIGEYKSGERVKIAFFGQPKGQNRKILKRAELEIKEPDVKVISTSNPLDAYPGSRPNVTSTVQAQNCRSCFAYGVIADGKKLMETATLKAGEKKTSSNLIPIGKKDLSLAFFANRCGASPNVQVRKKINALPMPTTTVAAPKQSQPGEEYEERVKIINKGGEGDVVITRNGQKYETISLAIGEEKTLTKKFKMPYLKKTSVKYDVSAVGVKGTQHHYMTSGPFTIEAVQALFADIKNKTLWIRAPLDKELTYTGTITAKGLEGVKPVFHGTLKPKEKLQIKFDDLIAAYIKFDKSLMMIENSKALGGRKEYRYDKFLGLARLAAPVIPAVSDYVPI